MRRTAHETTRVVVDVEGNGRVVTAVMEAATAAAHSCALGATGGATGGVVSELNIRATKSPQAIDAPPEWVITVSAEAWT